MLVEYEIDDVSCDDLPRGVLIGSVELHNCDGEEWLFAAATTIGYTDQADETPATDLV